jgi:hypothetical protein
VAAIYFGFGFSTEAIALNAPTAPAKAEALPLIPLEKSLILYHITTCDDIRRQANQQSDQMIFVTQRQHEQIKLILAVTGLSGRLIKENEIPEDVRALLIEMKQDPKALDKKTAQALKDIAELKQQVLGRCR